MRDYCTQNNGDCGTCSLVNYGRDCQNNRLLSFKCDCGKEWKEAGNFDLFFADVDYSKTYRSECPECSAKNLEKIAAEDNGAYLEEQAEIEVNHCIGGIKMRTWEREGYKVVEKEFDYSLHAFDVIGGTGEVIATITPDSLESMEGIVKALDDGEDVDGWEDGMGNTIYILDKEDFAEMIKDWQADHSPEMDGLKIEDPEIDPETGEWVAYAHDEKNTYIISDDGRGNITINYLGAK